MKLAQTCLTVMLTCEASSNMSRNVNILQNETCIIHRKLQLNGNIAPAAIKVSIAFQPVTSVAQSELCSRENFIPLSTEEDDLPSYSHTKGNSSTWMHQAVSYVRT